ncbi:MAG: hypothetical protein ACHQUA_01160 [Microgenomates group bacterium]
MDDTQNTNQQPGVVPAATPMGGMPAATPPVANVPTDAPAATGTSMPTPMPEPTATTPDPTMTGGMPTGAPVVEPQDGGDTGAPGGGVTPPPAA